ncbi:hypothetical protein ACIQXQ_20060 [Peribacillus sp. NPDC097198]|uniref:hypothetical protein n=1 Tax=Peribacillus sp. NPDC097198 TaxID=3364397 RepID=UPI00382D53A7
MTSLKISDIKKENDIYKVKVDVNVYVNGVKHVVKVVPFFKPSKVVMLVDDLIGFYKKAATEKITIEEKYEHDVIGYFMLKHFTNIKFTTSKTAYRIYDEFQSIIESPIYKSLLLAFPEESIKAVYERILDVQEASERIKQDTVKLELGLNKLVYKDILLSGVNNNDTSVL